MICRYKPINELRNLRDDFGSGMPIDQNGVAVKDFKEYTFYVPTKDVLGRDASERVALM